MGHNPGHFRFDAKYAPKMNKNVRDKLSAQTCKTAKPKEKSYKLSDGGGLYLEVSPTGSKYWRMKYRRPSDKKEDRLAFGVYPDLSLAGARAKRDEAKGLLLQDIDPKAKQKEEKATANGTYTFEAIARSWANHQMWSADHQKRVLSSLERYIFPAIGALDIRKLESFSITPLFQKVHEMGKHDTADRLKQRVKDVVRYARLSGAKTEIIPDDLNIRLKKRDTKHHAALKTGDLALFFQKLAGFNGNRITRLAIELTMLTFVRSSELRFARWNEFNLDEAQWVIPKKRELIEGVKFSDRGTKKGKVEHVVFLSRQAVSVIERLRQITGNYDVVFPSERNPKGVMSENTINKSLRLMGYNTQEEATAHGFRTLACSALYESGLWQQDAIERQMSHREKNDVKATYSRDATYNEERATMMQWWADYLDANRETHVTPYEFGKLNHNG